MNDALKLTGHIDITLFDKDGNIKDQRSIKNLVVTAGKTFLAAWLAASSQSNAFMPYVAVGSGSTAAALGDTALGSEITRALGTVTSSTNVLQNVVTLGAGVGTGAISECGLLSAASVGTMLARQVFSTVNKQAADSLQITWQITFA